MMKIAFCASEVFPFAKTGGLADVAGALPQALCRLGVDVAVFTPRYKTLTLGNRKVKRVNKRLSCVELDGGPKVYLVENKKYFGRNGLYGNARGDYQDNLKRFSFFCEAILAGLKEVQFRPDIVHCHDWHTALIPVLLREKYDRDNFFSRARTLLTIHNLAYQGVFPAQRYDDTGLPQSLFTPEAFEYYGKVNVLKAGTIFADLVSTVSPQYAKEIRTSRYGCGLEGILKHTGNRVWGVLNGLDYTVWNPKRDTYIAQKFGLSTLAQGKESNKVALCKYVGLGINIKRPLLGFVGRLSHQKGIDLMLAAMEQLLKEDVQIVIQGVGDERYQKSLRSWSRRYPDKLSVIFEFDEKLAHLIYAGADMFLMPSVFEPCGLSQMISFAYGTLPVVHMTGGLADTVVAHQKPRGNGFVFRKHTKTAFLRAVHQAVRSYQDKKELRRLRKNAMNSRFPWKGSAQQYKKIYQWLSSR